MVMKTVSVAVLKQKLSSYLHRVEEGEEIVVTAHRRPVANLIPHAGQAPRIRMPAREPGVLRRLKGVRLPAGRTAVDTLIEDRSRR